MHPYLTPTFSHCTKNEVVQISFLHICSHLLKKSLTSFISSGFTTDTAQKMSTVSSIWSRLKTIPSFLLIYFVEEFSPIWCHIFVDSFYFCSPWVTEKKSTIFGTRRLDWKGIPKTIRTIKNREKKSTQCIYGHYNRDENTMLVSYSDKTASDIKKLVVLTTMHL